MKLYGMGQSRSFRALWALEESGLTYEYIPVKIIADPSDPASARNEAYLKLNTQGKVPTLVDRELVLTESGAILNHIGRTAPAAGLIPNGDLNTAARYDQLCYFILTELEQPLWSNGKHRFALPEKQRIPAMLETANFEFAKAVSTLDQLSEDNEFAMGNQFSIVDILLAQTFNWAIRFKFDVPQKYIELRDRHYQRPAVQKCLTLVE
jgi:glutathione S-transferase